MSKKQQLSPEKYITTKARSLPIDKCYVTSRWRETMSANVVVTRRHVNGNYTVGLYLVDLLCLGIKDTFYIFNASQEEIDERFDVDELFLEEAPYELVHNIIYAAHDFALEFDIKPHKNFGITRYILEEDEAVPLMEIAVGDEDGNPYLLVNSSYNYAPILKKLREHAGEGNFTFRVDDDFEDDDDTDDEFEEETELDEDDQNDEYLDFNSVGDMETAELEEMIEDARLTISEELVVECELLLRQLDENEQEVIEEIETIAEKKDFQIFESKKEQWQKAYDNNEEALNELFPQLSYLGQNEGGLDDEGLMEAFLQLLIKHKTNDSISYIIASSIPLPTILSRLQKLEENFDTFTPALQLLIASYAVLLNKEDLGKYAFITNAATVDMAYPFNRMIHGMHYKLFWLLKAIQAIKQDDKEKILYYHNFLRVTGTGGHLKALYAAQLKNWLSNYMGIEEDEEDLDEDDLDDDGF